MQGVARLKGMVKGVESYIEAQKSPYKEILKRLRAIILKTFPSITEEMKYGVPCYEEKYYIVALRDHVNMGFSLKGLSEKEARAFEGTGKTMRHIKVYSVGEIDEKKIVKLLKIVKMPAH